MEDKKLPPTQSASADDASNSLDVTDANAPVSSYSLGQKNYPIENLEVHAEGQVIPAQEASMPTLLSIPFSRRKAVVVSIFITLAVLLVAGAASAFLVRWRSSQSPSSSQLNVPTQDVSLSDAGGDEILPELQGNEEAVLVNGDLITRGKLKVVSGDFATAFGAQDLSEDQTIILPDASGVLCLDSNNCNFVTEDQLGQLATTEQGVTLLNNSAGEVTLQGVPNRINITTADGVITLSTPQDLAIGSSPTFAALFLGGGLTVGGAIDTSLNCSVFANGGTLTTNVSGQLACADDEDSGGGGSVTQLNSMTGAITIQGTTNQINVASGGGIITLSTPQDIATTSSPTFGGLDVNGAAAIGSSATATPTTNALRVAHTVTGDCSFGCSGIEISLTGAINSIHNWGVNSKVSQSSSGTFSASAFYAAAAQVSGTGAIGSNYGLFVQNQTVGTSDYGVYVEGADTYGLWVDSGATRLDGTLELQTLGTTNTATYLCRNSSNRLAACNTTGAGAAFIQGGNSFGATATLGTNDANSLQLETNNVTRLTIDTSGNATLTGDLTVTGADIQSSAGLTVTGGTTQGNTLTLRGSSAAWSSTTPNNVDISNSRLRFTGQTSVSNGDFPSLISFSDTVNASGAASWGVTGFNFAPTITQNTSGSFGGVSAVSASPLLQPTAGGINDSGNFALTGFGANVRHALNHSGAAGTTNQAMGFSDSPFFQRAGGTGTHTITNYTGFQSFTARPFDDHVMAGYTITNSRGFQARNPEISGGGAITNNYGLYVENLTSGASDYGIYVQGADTYGLWVDSGATRLDGTLEVQTLGATDTASYLCRNSANQLAACTTGSGAAFVQGGNNFGGTGTLGLTSNNDLNVITNNLTRLTVQADGDLAADTDTLFVDATNNRVGIGTTTPGTGTVAVSLEVNSGGIGIVDSSPLVFSTGDPKYWSLTPVSANNQFALGYQGTTVLTVGNDGRLGVGVNGEPNARLEIQGDWSSNAWGFNGAQLQADAATFNDENTVGTVANAVLNSFAQSTLTASNTVTTTNAATVYIQDGPAAGTNQTITNSYALWVDDGTSRFDGDVTVQGNTNLGNDGTDTTTITGGSTTTDRLVITSVGDDGTHGEIHSSGDDEFSLSADGAMYFYSDRDADGAVSGSGYHFLKNDGIGSNDVVDINASNGNFHTIGDATVDGVAFMQTYLRLGVTTATIGDDGNGGTVAAGTITPDSTFVEFTCSDPQGCDVTLSESGTAQGQTLILVNVGTTNMNLADIAGVQQVAGASFAGTQYSSISFIKITGDGTTGLWAETAGSVN